MLINQSIKLGMWFLQSRVIQNAYSLIQINLSAGFLPKFFGIRLKSGQKSSKSIVGGSFFALWLDALGFGSTHVTRRGNDKVNVILVSYFRRIHSLFLSKSFRC